MSDPDQLLLEADESDNVAVNGPITAANVNGMSCENRVSQPLCTYQHLYFLLLILGIVLLKQNVNFNS